MKRAWAIGWGLAAGLGAALAWAESPLPEGTFVASAPTAEIVLASMGPRRSAGRLLLRGETQDETAISVDADLEIALATTDAGRMTLRPRDGKPELTYERVDAGDRSLRFERAPMSADGSHREREAWSFAFEGPDRIKLYREAYKCHAEGLRCSPADALSVELEKKKGG